MPEQETEETIGEFLLDSLETFIAKTDNQWDDKLVLPLIKCMRIAHNKEEK
jgi:hypothetical protein